MSTIHGIYGVKIGSTLIGGITAHRIDPGLEMIGEAASDAVHASIVSLAGGAPSITCSTKSVLVALDAGIDLGGVDLAASSAILYAQKRLQGGTRAGTLAHRSFTAAVGLIIPRTLSVDHQGDAVLSFDVIPVSADGSTVGIALAETVTLPTGADEDDRFTIGPITLGAVTIDQVKSWSLDYGVNALVEGGDSDLYPTHVSISNEHPVLTIRSSKTEHWKESGAIPSGGLACTHANSSIYLRKRASSGSYIADGTTSHIKFTVDGLAVITDLDGTTGQRQDVGIRVRLRNDGSNAPIVTSTGVAIT
jgi:hypothetical protein